MKYKILVLCITVFTFTLASCESSDEKETKPESSESGKAAAGQKVTPGAGGDQGTAAAGNKNTAAAGNKNAAAGNQGGDGKQEGEKSEAAPGPLYLTKGKCAEGTNCLSGEGKKKYINGAVYKGEFEDGLPHGKGWVVFPDGTFYQGQWKQGRFNGQGKYKSGGSPIYFYTGVYSNGKEHGKGAVIYPTNNIYIGDWDNGTRHGSGIWVHSNGKKAFRGSFDRDRLTSEKKWLDGEKLENALKKAKKVRQAAFVFVSKAKTKTENQGGGEQAGAEPTGDQPNTGQ